MVNKTNFISATDVRKEWSQVIDGVVREKPQFIRRTRDNIIMTDFILMETILEKYTFTANEYIEEDKSVTLALNEIDLVENGTTEEEAKYKLAKEIMEYAQEYYNDFEHFKNTPNRKQHVPYVLKALILQDIKRIGDSIQCRLGKS